jgi:hypothetical protein
MPTVATQCPACAHRLLVSRLTCPECSTQIEGAFDLPALLQLSPEELDFVVNFVRASGSLKEMARIRGQSYPTIRNKLDEIIHKLEANGRDVEQERHKILDAIAKGKLTVKEAAKKLREVGQ